MDPASEADPKIAPRIDERMRITRLPFIVSSTSDHKFVPFWSILLGRVGVTVGGKPYATDGIAIGSAVAVLHDLDCMR